VCPNVVPAVVRMSGIMLGSREQCKCGVEEVKRFAPLDPFDLFERPEPL